jgi:hypothetical protein
MVVISLSGCLSVVPEILEAVGRHLGVSNRVHDILVAYVLERSGVMPVVGELVAGGVPEHVGMNREWKLCGLPGPGDCFKESHRLTMPEQCRLDLQLPILHVGFRPRADMREAHIAITSIDQGAGSGAWES